MVSDTVDGVIELRGVTVHNLKSVDLDIPRSQLVVLCGVSGSGKTSLALDTLYAEGQRRYIESFSAYTRQFLERFEKPAAERISGIPPAIAVTNKEASRSSRSTIGTATETADYLRLLYAKVGQFVCPSCGREVHAHSAESVVDLLTNLDRDLRMMICYPLAPLGEQVAPPSADNLSTDAGEPDAGEPDERGFDEGGFDEGAESPRREPKAGQSGQVGAGYSDEACDWETLASNLREDGFRRVIRRGVTVDLDGARDGAPEGVPAAAPLQAGLDDELLVVVDRLKSDTPRDRLNDSLELAFARSSGRCAVLIQATADAPPPALAERGERITVDGRPWWLVRWNTQLRCDACQLSLPEPEPRLFSFNSPLGACAACEGFGNLIDIDHDQVVPDTSKCLREGAVAPWNTPSYQHELEELLALADDYGLPVDVPYRDLTAAQKQLIWEGVPERDFGGLRGFFAWLERRKYKMPIRIFLSRWRSYRTCEDCQGTRLNPVARSSLIGGKNIADLCQMRIEDLSEFLHSLELPEYQSEVSRLILEQVRCQVRYLEAVGLGYLTLDRTLRTLSGGEAQRVALSNALGSSLVNMLYVLDEPTVGLHPADVQRLVGAIEGLRDRGNTVVVVEHEEALLRAADHVVEIGSGAGERGGEVVFHGTPEELLAPDASITGEYLAGRRGISIPEQRRAPNHGWVRLTGARGNNLKNLEVSFPLNVLCLVTGVSGSGKSTLVQDTLYGALCRRKRKDVSKPCPYDDVFGDGQIDDVVLVDQSPIGRTPRSNPVTYIKAFDAIRAVFADTLEARTHNYSAGQFSFNVDGGRCTECQGDGYIKKDMQFLADVYMTCAQCGGTRYRKEILAVTYRGKNIAEVLDLTVREAFSFFRGQRKVQAKLKQLMDVGLDYLRLGQPANTLSAGEAQRVKLAAHLSAKSRQRTLFILDEPTTGLHFADVVQLLDCFDALLGIGHSLIVVEHNLQLMKAADYLIDLGPGAGDLGGQVVAQGSPEEIAANPASATGTYLAQALRAEAASSQEFGEA